MAYSATNKRLENLPLDQLLEDEDNERPNQAVSDPWIAAIGEEGMIEPVVAYPLFGDYKGYYRLQSGHRRFRAATVLGYKTISAIIVDPPKDVKDRTLKRLAANLSREDIDPIAKAKSFRLLLDEGMSQTELARRLGISQPAVAQTVKLLELPAEVQELVRAGKLSSAHGAELCRITLPRMDWEGTEEEGVPEVQLRLAERAIRETHSARELRRRVGDYEEDQARVRASVERMKQQALAKLDPNPEEVARKEDADEKWRKINAAQQFAKQGVLLEFDWTTNGLTLDHLKFAALEFLTNDYDPASKHTEKEILAAKTPEAVMELFVAVAMKRIYVTWAGGHVRVIGRATHAWLEGVNESE